MFSAFFKSEFISNCFLDRSGMIGWVAQGLTKVLPQPDSKYKETNDDNEEHTEVRRKDSVCLTILLQYEVMGKTTAC